MSSNNYEEDDDDYSLSGYSSDEIDPFEEKLRYIQEHGNPTDQLVAIQTRINHTVLEFDEALGTDTLADLRFQSDQNSRKRIEGLLKAQERRAVQLKNLRKSVENGPESDLDSSDDEWKIEEKKIFLGMESDNTLAVEGSRNVQNLIMKITGIQSGAASRLSSLILEIDAMLQGLKKRHEDERRSVLLEGEGKQKFTNDAIKHVRVLLQQAREEKDQVQTMLNESKNELVGLQKELIHERTKVSMKTMLQKSGIKKMTKQNQMKSDLSKLKNALKEIDELKEQNAKLKLKLNSQTDYDELKTALNVSQANVKVQLKKLETLQIEFDKSRKENLELVGSVDALERGYAHAKESTAAQQVQIDNLLRKQKSLVNQAKDSEGKKLEALENDFAKSKKKNAQKLQELHVETNSSLERAENAKAEALLQLKKLQIEKLELRDENTALKKKLRDSKNKLQLFSTKAKRGNNVMDDVQKHGAEQDARKIKDLSEQLKVTETNLKSFRRSSVELQRSQFDTKTILEENQTMSARIHTTETMLLNAQEQLKLVTSQKEEMQRQLHVAESQITLWKNRYELFKFQNEANAVVAEMQKKTAEASFVNRAKQTQNCCEKNHRYKVVE